MANYYQLYVQDTPPESAFLLNNGSVYYYISNSDKYVLKGKNVIIGNTELILNHMLGIDVKRLETAVTTTDTNIKKIPIHTFLEGLYTYSFLLNVSIVIARQVVLTNQIIKKNQQELEKDTPDLVAPSLHYYNIIAKLKEEYRIRKLPWLKEFIATYETSLVYKQGEIYYRTQEPVRIIPEKKLDNKLVEFTKDTIIFEEGSSGQEMYILHSGSIDVLVNNKKIATLNEEGTAIGEISLLLGEQRTATLRANNTVVLTRIEKSDLREISKTHIEVFLDIARSIAKKHYNNVIKIHTINNQILDKKFSTDDEERKRLANQHHQALTQLSFLKTALKELLEKKGATFIEDQFSDLL